MQKPKEEAWIWWIFAIGTVLSFCIAYLQRLFRIKMGSSCPLRYTSIFNVQDSPGSWSLSKHQLWGSLCLFILGREIPFSSHSKELFGWWVHQMSYASKNVEKCKIIFKGLGCGHSHFFFLIWSSWMLWVYMRYEGCCICLVILKLACNEECWSRPGDFCKISECAECLSSQFVIVLFW